MLHLTQGLTLRKARDQGIATACLPLKQFEASFMNGFAHFDKLDEDRDLDGIRKDQRFSDLVARYRERSPTK